MTARALLAVCVLVASHWGAYLHGQSVEQANAGKTSAKRDSGDRLAEVIGERDARKEEQRRTQAQEEARTNAQEERTVADIGAASADASGHRMRDDAANFAATISCPGADTGALARGQAATRAAMVLSDLLARADERAGELAQAYDRARIAGAQCENEYMLLTPH